MTVTFAAAITSLSMTRDCRISRRTEYHENFNHQHQNVRTENGIEYGDLPKFVELRLHRQCGAPERGNPGLARVGARTPGGCPPVRTKQLQNDSTLEWKASPGGLAAGYEVLWRETTFSDWQHVLPVGNVTRATLPVSKDNVIFAVRAVDAKGHRSLPIVPQPER